MFGIKGSFHFILFFLKKFDRVKLDFWDGRPWNDPLMAGGSAGWDLGLVHLVAVHHWHDLDSGHIYSK